MPLDCDQARRLYFYFKVEPTARPNAYRWEEFLSLISVAIFESWKLKKHIYSNRKEFDECVREKTAYLATLKSKKYISS